MITGFLIRVDDDIDLKYRDIHLYKDNRNSDDDEDEEDQALEPFTREHQWWMGVGDDHAYIFLRTKKKL